MLYATLPNVQALRKPLKTDVGITAPRICVEAIMTSLVFSFEVSQASYVQDESITPLFTLICRGQSSLNPVTKLAKISEMYVQPIKNNVGYTVSHILICILFTVKVCYDLPAFFLRFYCKSPNLTEFGGYIHRIQIKFVYVCAERFTKEETKEESIQSRMPSP